jgi:Tfp pilus assembly protein PilX
MIQIKQPQNQSGFALLITILVLSVVVAVTLAIVELSIKQLKLSTDSTDSEIAFHAANAGLECARYTRRIESASFETGAAVDFDCFGVETLNVAKVGNGFITNPATLPATAQVNRYRHNITWGAAPNERCTSMDITAMVATTSFTIGGTLSSQRLPNFINSYENATKTCAAGERCTVMSVIGYSSACNATSSAGVLKREILLEL